MGGDARAREAAQQAMSKRSNEKERKCVLLYVCANAEQVRDAVC